MSKLHPMLFSTTMVQAILYGRKSQTRRIIKPQPQPLPGNNQFIPMDEMIDNLKELSDKKMQVVKTYNKSAFAFPKQPYLPGDVLWVRESFLYVLRDHAHDLLEGSRTPNQWAYAASFHEDWYAYAKSTYGYKWKPGIHMPFEAARIFLRIKSVKYERLQDILDADAIAEGILKIDEEAFKYDDLPGSFASVQSAFRALWRIINGTDSWEQNPWVWVIEFERITKEEALRVKEVQK